MSLEEIKENAIELKKLREEKEALNDKLKDINDSIRDIEEHRLSSMMDDEGITDITLGDIRVKRGVVFRGGITTTSNPDDFKYLFDTDNSGALKQKILIDMAEHPEVPETLDSLGISYEKIYSIHHMTLSSIIKELFTEGKLSTEDLDKYRIYAQPQVKVEQK